MPTMTSMFHVKIVIIFPIPWTVLLWLGSFVPSINRTGEFCGHSFSGVRGRPFIFGGRKLVHCRTWERTTNAISCAPRSRTWEIVVSFKFLFGFGHVDWKLCIQGQSFALQYCIIKEALSTNTIVTLTMTSSVLMLSCILWYHHWLLSSHASYT